MRFGLITKKNFEMKQSSNIWNPQPSIPNPIKPGIEIKKSNPTSSNRAHCSYCMLDNPEYLVKCKTTGRYFCNRTINNGLSHIIHHLTKSRTTEIELPPDTPLQSIPLECIHCRTNNIFSLGFYQSKQTNEMMILCRHCAQLPELRQFNLDYIKDFPIVVTDPCRQIGKWLIPDPPEQLCKDLPLVTSSDISILEETWVSRPDVSILDVPQIKRDSTLQPVKLSYTNPADYSSILSPIVKAERQHDKEKTESFKIDRVSLTFTKINSTTYTASFNFPLNELPRPIHLGDNLLFKDINSQFDQNGVIIDISQSGKLEVRFDDIKDQPVDTQYTVRLIWNGVHFDRMISALELFTKSNSTSSNIKDFWLGKCPENSKESSFVFKNANIAGLPRLNESQHNAVQFALQNSFSMIQGPPGTGKTTTIATLVHQFVKRNDGQVLVTAPSNVAVERVTEAIAKTGVSVVRVVTKSRESFNSAVDKYSLHNIIHQVDFDEKNKLNQLSEIRKNRLFTDNEKEQYNRLISKAENYVLDAAKVICCTCSTSGEDRLLNRTFKFVIIDEATQAPEPELLISILHQSRQIVLVGDHCQLGPVVLYSKAIEAGFGKTIVERLIDLGLKPHRLLTQYRMHPILSEFVSNTFYEGTLLNGISLESRRPPLPVYQWPQPFIPLVFYNNKNNFEESADSGTSFLNKYEATIVSNIVTQLLNSGVSPNSIGIITPYSGQIQYITTFLHSNYSNDTSIKNIAINTVDSYQGSEKDYIIFSCVRCNTHNTIGFLNDIHRLNVALTRARMGLFVIGCADLLANCSPAWFSFVKYCYDKKVLIEEFHNNTPHNLISIKKPKKDTKLKINNGFIFTPQLEAKFDEKDFDEQIE